MHKQEFDGKSPVTGLKGIGEQAILPFLETPGTKVWWPYALVTPVCRFGNSLVATLRLCSQNKCHFHHQSHPHSQLLKETNFKSLYHNMHWYHCCELLCFKKAIGYHCTGLIQIPRKFRTGWGCSLSLYYYNVLWLQDIVFVWTR